MSPCPQLTQLSEHNVHISAEVDQLINDKNALEEVVKALMGEIRAVRVQQGDYKWVAPLPTQDVGECTARYAFSLLGAVSLCSCFPMCLPFPVMNVPPLCAVTESEAVGGHAPAPVVQAVSRPVVPVSSLGMDDSALQTPREAEAEDEDLDAQVCLTARGKTMAYLALSHSTSPSCCSCCRPAAAMCVFIQLCPSRSLLCYCCSPFTPTVQ